MIVLIDKINRIRHAPNKSKFSGELTKDQLTNIRKIFFSLNQQFILHYPLFRSEIIIFNWSMTGPLNFCIIAGTSFRYISTYPDNANSRKAQYFFMDSDQSRLFLFWRNMMNKLNRLCIKWKWKSQNVWLLDKSHQQSYWVWFLVNFCNMKQWLTEWPGRPLKHFSSPI